MCKIKPESELIKNLNQKNHFMGQQCQSFVSGILLISREQCSTLLLKENLKRRWEIESNQVNMNLEEYDNLEIAFRYFAAHYG